MTYDSTYGYGFYFFAIFDRGDEYHQYPDSIADLESILGADIERFLKI